MDLETWRSGNGRYLAASMQWLRLKLLQLADQVAEQNQAKKESVKPSPPPYVPPEPMPESEASARWFFRRTAPPVSRPRLLEAPRAEREDVRSNIGPTPEELKATEAAREEASKMEPKPALLLLREQLRLSPFEQDVLLLCAAMELDTRIPALCAMAMGNSNAPYPTFALALALFDSPSWDALTAQRPLRLWKLIELVTTSNTSLTAAPLRADERIVGYLKGLNALDPRLAILLRRVSSRAGATLPASQNAQAEGILARWSDAPAEEPPAASVLLGPYADCKILVAQQAASALGRELFTLEADALPQLPAEIESLARLWQRESALMPLALYVDAQTDGMTASMSGALDRFVTQAVQSEGVIFVGSREPLAHLGCESFLTDVKRPTAVEQRDAWSEALQSLPVYVLAPTANRLASQYSMNIADIQRAVAATPKEPDGTWTDRVWDQCRDRNRPRLDALAQRIEAKATWNDLVLNDETTRMLREIAMQVSQRGTVYEDWGFGAQMNRGLGISALFAGDSGTGKTMAAEVLAQDLRLSLYRIDLSQVVSKYIGETEKNLQRVFDLMEGGGSILFFDEADALFGKRSEVKDSHDRYANIEINYLLQRMETYTGLAILATNMKSALDPAFVRRLRFIVPFSYPSPVERRAMWAKAFPAAVPVEQLDLERLAKLNLTGANIQNVVLNAAFLAAQAGSPVTMPLLLRAVRTELRKIERPVSETELQV
jgi:hypothetical protein